MWLKRFYILAILVLLIINSTYTKISEYQYTLMPPLFYFDNYDECLTYGQNAMYCRTTFQLYPEDPKNSSETWNIIKEISSFPKNYRHDILRHGICITKRCPNITQIQGGSAFFDKLEECCNKKYRHMGIRGNIHKISCETQTSPYHIGLWDVLFGSSLLMFLILVLYATFVDALHRENKTNEEKSFFEKFIYSFSIFQNWNRLNKVDLNNSDFKALRCMQGVRFYSMICIIFSHTVAVNLSIPVFNPRYTENLADTLGVKLLTDGSRYAIVQTYFMMSSWLLTFQFFSGLEVKRKLSMAYLFQLLLKRYIRLTPTLALMVGFHTTWMVHFSRGPFWDQVVGNEYKKCRQNWWSNLLYLSNYIHGPTMCSGHHWYIAVDTQFYIMGLVLLSLIWYKQNKILQILGTILIFHVSTVFYIMYSYKLEAVIPLYPEVLYDMNIVNLDETIYKNTIFNLPGLVIGIGFGYAFFKYRNKKIFIKRIYITLWWILSWGLILIIIVLPGVLEYSSSYRQNRELWNALYGSVNRTIFIFGLGLWMFGVTQGEGSLTKSFCEWHPTYVLGRLTYSTFLVHSLFQRLKVGNKRSPHYINNFFIFYETVGDVAVAYLGALVLCLFFEMPFAEFKKQLTRQSKML